MTTSLCRSVGCGPSDAGTEGPGALDLLGAGPACGPEVEVGAAPGCFVSLDAHQEQGGAQFGNSISIPGPHGSSSSEIAWASNSDQKRASS